MIDYIKNIKMNNVKKIKVLRKNDPESMQILNKLSNPEIFSLDTILSRKNMQIQKQF